MLEFGALPLPGSGRFALPGGPLCAEVHATAGAVVQIGTLEIHLGAGGSAPTQLPSRVVDLTGRSAETATLVAAAARGDAAVQISGGAGSGKSALAVAAAHALRGAYPDGQIALALHGHDGARSPTAHELLATVLRSLHVPDRDIPADHAALLALYRTVLAERRVLVLADDAASLRQVGELAPPGGRSFAIVTSRRLLPGLGGAQIRLAERPDRPAPGR